MAASMGRKDVNLNNFVYRYLVELGMTEEATQEFVRKAKQVKGLQRFETFGDWMKITEPYQVLQNMEGMGPFEVNGPARSFDLNLPPDDQEEQPNWEETKQVADVEDEESCAGKRKMRDEALENHPIDLVKKKKHAAKKGKNKMEE